MNRLYNDLTPFFIGLNLEVAGHTPIKTVCYALDVNDCALGGTECSAKTFIPLWRDKSFKILGSTKPPAVLLVQGFVACHADNV